MGKKITWSQMGKKITSGQNELKKLFQVEMGKKITWGKMCKEFIWDQKG